MPETEISLLKKENARLNLIIEALLFQNEALKAGYSVSEKGNTPPEFGYSVSEKGNVSPEFGYSVSEKGNAPPEFGYSVAEKDNGITEVLRSLPEKVEPDWSNVSKVNQKLRSMEKGKVKRSGSINSAKLLIHFHNKSGSSHPELRKLTDLSKGGLGKMIMSLTKRGLIVRDGWQKYALTAGAKKLMEEALG